LFYSSRIAREILFSGSDMKEGNSGSPLIKGDEVVGVVTSVTDFAHANSSVSIIEFLQGVNGGSIVLGQMEKWGINWREAYDKHLKETSMLAEQQRIAAEKATKEAEDRRKQQLPKGLIVAYATDISGIAYGNSKHGHYTDYLLEEIQETQPIEQVFRKVSNAVKKHTQSYTIQQTPRFTTSLSGEFCLGGCSKTKALPNSVKQLALVIGNTLPNDISGTINDAHSMAEVLRAKGFEVILRTDTNFSEMNKAIQDFVKSLSVENGVGLFYFAGLGARINGENYLESKDDNGFVSVNNIIEQMKVANNKLNIIILDTMFVPSISVVPQEQE